MNSLMKLKLLGVTIRLEYVIIAILLYLVISGNLLTGCSKVSLKEGMQMLMGSSLDYNMGEGVQGSWSTKTQQQGNSISWRSQDHDSYNSEMVSSDVMNFFANTDFSPNCCGSTYSANGGLTGQGYTSGGCACLSPEQMNFLNQRGGNRTMNTEY